MADKIVDKIVDTALLNIAVKGSFYNEDCTGCGCEKIHVSDTDLDAIKSAEYTWASGEEIAESIRDAVIRTINQDLIAQISTEVITDLGRFITFWDEQHVGCGDYEKTFCKENDIECVCASTYSDAGGSDIISSVKDTLTKLFIYTEEDDTNRA